MTVFEPSRDLEGALAQARSDFESWRQVRGVKKDARWAEWAGDELAAMMRDREATIRLLKSETVRLRLAAASLLAEYWPASEQVASEVMRSAFEDPEPAVRGAALYALWTSMFYVSDPSGFLGQLFARLFSPLPDDDAIKEMLRQVGERRRRRQEVARNMWGRCAGMHAERMCESRPVAESYLADPDPNLRRAALMSLRSHWRLGRDKDFGETCERLVFEDPDVEVRSLALGFLSLCYLDSDDSRVGCLAAQLVVDDSAPRKLRATAYLALIVIRGLPIDAFIAASRSSSRFPEGVDWAFVDSFLRRGS